MLTRLTLKDFRNHVRTEIAFAPLTIIAGQNGAGKSTIAAAIEFALTGGNDFGALPTQVRHGAKEAEVEVALEDGVEFNRTIPSPKGVTKLNQEIEAHFGLPLKSISDFLRCRGLSELKPDDLKGRLHTFFGGTMTDEEWAQDLDDWSPEQPGLGDWAKANGWNRAKREPKGPHAFWYGQRTAEKKALADLQRRLSIAQEAAPPTGFDPKALAAARNRRADVNKTITEKETEAKSQAKVHESNRLRFAQAQAERKRAEFDVNRLKDEAARVADEAMAASRSALPLEPLQKNAEGARAALAEAETAVAETVAAMAALNEQEACPVGSCAKAESKRLTELLMAQQDALKATRRAAEEAERDLAKAGQHHLNAARWSADHTTACDRVREAEQRLRDLPVMEAPEEGPSQQVLADLLKPYLDERNALIERIAAAQEAERRHAAYEVAMKEAGLLEKQAAEQAAVVEKVDALVKATDPEEGIPVRRIAEAVGELMEDAQGYANVFFDLGLIWHGNTWTLTNEVRIPVHQLSWSERARVSACLQVALADQVGFPFVIIDEHALDPENRGALYDFLLESGVQAIVLSTLFEVADVGFLDPIAPPDERVAMYVVEGGKVRRIEVAAEVAS